MKSKQSLTWKTWHKSKIAKIKYEGCNNSVYCLHFTLEFFPFASKCWILQIFWQRSPLVTGSSLCRHILGKWWVKHFNVLLQILFGFVLSTITWRILWDLLQGWETLFEISLLKHIFSTTLENSRLFCVNREKRYQGMCQPSILNSTEVSQTISTEANLNLQVQCSSLPQTNKTLLNCKSNLVNWVNSPT